MVPEPKSFLFLLCLFILLFLFNSSNSLDHSKDNNLNYTDPERSLSNKMRFSVPLCAVLSLASLALATPSNVLGERQDCGSCCIMQTVCGSASAQQCCDIPCESDGSCSGTFDGCGTTYDFSCEVSRSAISFKITRKKPPVDGCSWRDIGMNNKAETGVEWESERKVVVRE